MVVEARHLTLGRADLADQGKGRMSEPNGASFSTLAIHNINMTYEFGKQYELWDCPFCGKNTISVLHFPKSVSIKRTKTASLPGSKGFHKNPDIHLIRSGCSSCGNTSEAVERKFKEEGIV